MTMHVYRATRAYGTEINAKKYGNVDAEALDTESLDVESLDTESLRDVQTEPIGADSNQGGEL